MQNNVFYTILLRFVAIIFHRQTIIARVFLLLCLNWYNENTFVFVLQCILIPELWVYSFAMFIKTCKLFLIEIQSLIFNFYGVLYTLQKRELPPNPPSTVPPMAVEYELLEKYLPIVTIGEVDGQGLLGSASENNSTQIPDFPYQLEKQKNGNWLVNGEEKSIDQLKKIHSKYKSEYKNGKAKQRSMQQYIFYTNVLQEIERLDNAEKKRKDLEYSQNIENQLNTK
jgi:hypothetical protein